MTALKSNQAIAVRDALLEDERTADSGIEVVAESSIITLSGEVASREIRQAAAEIARSQTGVVEVINDIKVVEPDPVRGVPPAMPPVNRW